MKLTGNQRKLYTASLVMLIAAIALACTWTLWGGQDDVQDNGVVQVTMAPDASVMPTEAAPQPTATMESTQANVQTVTTVAYYQDEYGYLVPVTMSIPMEEGIGKATLNLMVSNEANDLSAARLGLRPVIPENTIIELNISEGKATVDLSSNVLDITSAEAEAAMIDGIVHALTEFPTVESVEFLIGGQKLEKLTNGTDVSGEFKRGGLNAETMASSVSAEDANTVTLYFQSASSTALVPVTREVKVADINTAVLELVKGPSADGMLEAVIPSGTALRDVSVENGVATVDFTGDFMKVLESADGGEMALRSIALTCSGYDGVNSVNVLVDGQPLSEAKDVFSIPTFINMADDIIYNAILAQSESVEG